MIRRTQNKEVSAQSAKKMFEILSYTIERFFLECDKYYRYHKFVQKGIMRSQKPHNLYIQVSNPSSFYFFLHAVNAY